MKSSAIAIVGMAGRFPGARNVEEFWRNLRDGVESIRTLSDGELRAAGVSTEDLKNPDYIKASAVLDDVDMFDAAFFGLSPRDAAIMDPQHRHFLECAWEALESAGHTPEGFEGSIGVFAGSGMNAYMMHNLLQNRRLVDSAGLFLIRQTGNDKDVLATRVSYQLNLHGPSLSVQTACSTSLVAVHLACQSLLHAECDMALAGGVTIEIPHAQGYLYREGEILSSDGHCRAFDAASSGTVFSSGAGIVVLRRLEDAIADHDTIHAVILGSAVNNDGARKVGYLAPSVEGQAEVIAEALGVAGICADDVSYIETHGTGTTVGDPIEIKGLTQAFRAETQRNGYCAIGSLKTNVGHLDTAAGVAGLIKTTLALQHQELPASLHFQAANPLIDFKNSPFYVNKALTAWPANGKLRHAGVTALGIGGTNAHIVLEEAPPIERRAKDASQQVIALSAKTETALEQVTARMAAHLREHPEVRLEDVAFTSQTGRRAFQHRRIVVADDGMEAAELLSTQSPKRVFTGTVMSSAPSVVFMFSGQGGQYVDMGAELYRLEPIFRRYMDICSEGFKGHLGLDLRELLYPSEENAAIAATQLNRTCIAQPALFAVEYSLAQWWMAHGVKPHAMVGHSVGEYVAACVAGVFSLDDALEAIAARGSLMQAMESGSMLAVQLAPEELTLPDSLSLAAINAPQQCVVSGPTDAIDAFEQELTKREISCRLLRTSHAFHSSMMDPMLAYFGNHMRAIPLRAPRVPYISNVTGTWITDAQATDPEYWSQHLRDAVRFSDSVVELLRNSDRVLLEVGPGQTLAALAKKHAPQRTRIFSSMRRQEEAVSDAVYLKSVMGQLWIAGVSVDWSSLHIGADVRRIPLPTYPFERQRFWIEADSAAAQHHSESRAALPDLSSGATILRESENIDAWFFGRTWNKTLHPSASPSGPLCWLIFMDSVGLGAQMSLQLRGAEHQVIQVVPGATFKRVNSHTYMIRTGMRADYDALLVDLDKRNIHPQKVVHLWSLHNAAISSSMEGRLESNFYSLLYLAQALGDQDQTQVDMAVVSDRLHAVQGERVSDPLSAVLLGPTKVIPKEFPGMICRNIDIDLQSQGAGQLAVQVIAEHCAAPGNSIVAYRNGDRLVESFKPIDVSASRSTIRLKDKGVYLITGGLGDIGLVMAEHLARMHRARLILISRTLLPASSEWKTALEAEDTPDRIREKVSKLMEMESLGAEVLVVSADITNSAEVKHAIELARQRFGKIDGVIHAAGVVEDGPLQLKTPTSAASVLSPKVQGTLVLDEALRDSQLDFFALFSSVSSVLAPAGQVDYVAANAFLDAFAASKQDAPVIAINWGPWTDVGMAVRTGSLHPLFQRRLAETRDEIAYACQLSCAKHWVLSEHRMANGRAVFPGTGYLEMAAAALTHGSFEQGVEFEDVFFLSPLFVDPDETKDVRIQLQHENGAGYYFSVSTNEAGWTEHASGQVMRCRKAPPKDRNISEILRRCVLQTIAFGGDHHTHQEKFFHFGPRWKNLKEIHLGQNEALTDLELSAEFSQDAQAYQLHPAVFDLATGAALYLIPDYGKAPAVYMPLSYKKATIYRPLCQKMHSHIRSSKNNAAGNDVVTFDLTLMDGDGRVLAEIEGFSLRLIREPMTALNTVQPKLRDHASRVEAQPVQMGTGIGSAEGIEAFLRILSSGITPGVIVSPQPLAIENEIAFSEFKSEKQPTTFVDDVEAALAEWWKELLGLQTVGVDEDFFDLGGQSLIVARLFSKIKKNYGVALGLSTLFEARTIRQLAKLIRQEKTVNHLEPKPWSPIVPIQPKGTRPPLYVISGLGGNVIKFHSMAFYLGEDQPVYGLLPRGLDGREPYFTRVEDLAAYYVDAIRGVQPEGPYRLVGYSFGGAVAFEMAQQIVAQGREVGLLGMFDTIEWQYMEQVEKSLHSRARLEVYKEQLKQEWSGEDRLGGLKRRMAAKFYRLTYRLFTALGRPVPQGMGTMEDIHAFAGSTYKAKIYPGTLTLFRSTMREPLDGDDAYLGWGDFVAGGIEVHPVPATHESILQEPGVQVLSEQLRKCLEGERKPVSRAVEVAQV
ncbi:MAG TPA: SDR family NAD(P)-dependent oxidoreductase [Acidobacteriaceae bacterium]|jgi:acyl transferase domain-containing protein/thioesterase domain-containing protein/acyl carrier protein|nr:SDR family NAD(P)-dependent oxidoreductase [Acidobacteriaceae bacterium]